MFVTVARQMRTINYMLSSQRCMDEGWTIRPPSPVLEDEPNSDIFEPVLLAEGEGKVLESPGLHTDTAFQNVELCPHI